MKWKKNFNLCILLPKSSMVHLISLKSNERHQNVGKPPFDLKYMIKLIFYGYINKITSTIVLDYNAKHNDLYNMISYGIGPSDRTIRDYIKYFSRFIS